MHFTWAIKVHLFFVIYQHINQRVDESSNHLQMPIKLYDEYTY